MKRAVMAIFCVLAGAYGHLQAQEMSDSYERIFQQSLTSEVESDTMLLYMPLGEQGRLFDYFTRWSFNFVTYRARGERLRAEQTLLWGLMRLPQQTAELSLQGNVRYSTQKYAFGADILASGTRWGAVHQFSISTRQGNDAFVDGVSTNSFSLSYAIDKTLGDTRIRATIMGSRSVVGQRGWTMQEVFDLAGNRLYNPSWGWLDGEKVNARQRRNTPLFALVELFLPQNFTITTSWIGGERTITGLTWYDATNPYPDYYTKLPSYWADDMDIAEVWRQNDTRYTQLDWEELIRINRMSGHTAYVADEQVEAVNNFEVTGAWRKDFTASDFVEVGVILRHETSEYFQRVRSLLGGDKFYDIDQYLVDDELFGDKVENDLRSVGRKVGVGDKYGYDYIIRRPVAIVYTAGEWLIDRFFFDWTGEVAFKSLERQGLFEKATFPNNGSYGRSKSVAFTTFSLVGDVVYTMTPNNRLLGTLKFGTQEPEYEDIFLAPQSNNYTTPTLRAENFVSLEFGYRGYPLGWLNVEATGYADVRWRGTEIYRYYDDTYHLYSLATLSDAATIRAGVEIAAEAELTNRLSLRTAAALNYYRYASNPSLNIVADVDLSPLLTNSQSAVAGMAVSPSPTAMLLVGLRYYNPSGWLADVSYSVAGGRYIVPDPVRRTNHVAQQASSPENRAAFLTQQRMPIASNVRIYVSRRWQRWTFAVSVDNLFNSDNIYGAYEQMRIRRIGVSPNISYAPSPIRMLYSYPRSITLSVSYGL